VPPGTSAQYKVIGQISDGTTQDLTTSSTWRSSDDGVLAISESGGASGGKAGEVVLAAEKNGKRASLQVLVLAPGTFRVTGLVSDSGTAIPGATVDVLNGSRAAMTTQTDADGIYRLYGLSGAIELRVRALGYPEQVRALTVTDGARYDFALPARSQSNGSYRLTIAADATACPSTGRNPWPEGLRVRTYDATVTQTGSDLAVS
jgi:hypothetical protein